MKKLLGTYNPFIRHSDRELMIAGIVITLLGILLSIIFQTIQDGIIDLHYTALPYYFHILAVVINVLLLSGILFIFGKRINSKTRFIDILNATMVARWPIYLSIIVMGNSYVKGKMLAMTEAITDLRNIQLNFEDIMWTMLIAFTSIPGTVWFLILLFSGFKVAVNARTWTHYFLFALAIFFSMVLSYLCFFLIF